MREGGRRRGRGNGARNCVTLVRIPLGKGEKGEGGKGKGGGREEWEAGTGEIALAMCNPVLTLYRLVLSCLFLSWLVLYFVAFCCLLFSFLPSFLPPFLPSARCPVPPRLPPFRPSPLPSSLPSFLPISLPSFFRPFFVAFLPSHRVRRMPRSRRRMFSQPRWGGIMECSCMSKY